MTLTWRARRSMNRAAKSKRSSSGIRSSSSWVPEERALAPAPCFLSRRWPASRRNSSFRSSCGRRSSATRWKSGATITPSSRRAVRCGQIRLVEILNDRGYIEQRSTVAVDRVGAHESSHRQRPARFVTCCGTSPRSTRPISRCCLPGTAGCGWASPSSILPPDVTERRTGGQAALRCCENPFYAFHGPPGTSLVCIQGDWSNVVDAKIKGRIAAMGLDSRSPYTPLYARARERPPWGVTALFAEYTGKHPPLDLDWTLERRVRAAAIYRGLESEALTARQPAPPGAQFPELHSETRNNRCRAAARGWLPDLLGVCCCGQPFRPRRARIGEQRAAPAEGIPIDGAEVRRLCYRGVVSSPSWPGSLQIGKTTTPSNSQTTTTQKA